MMSHPSPHEEDEPPALKPRPRRPFELSSLTPASSAPTTPPPESHAFLQANKGVPDGSATPSRTRSILNLTSSTLFGIYAPTGYANDREELTTPWGTGAETPADSRNGSFDFSRASIPDMTWQRGPTGLQKRRRSTVPQLQPRRMQRRGFKAQVLPVVARTTVLAAVGVLYGVLISHLHDQQQIAPVKVEGIDRSAWPYYAFWGTVGAVLGQALPALDSYWEARDDDIEETEQEQQDRDKRGWNEAVRAITAFVGIAFAIRKLPWQSTLQLSLTLALANPAVWYLIDRSAPGFILSSVVALSGTVVLLGINPALVPSPTPAHVLHGHVAKNSGSNATANVAGTDDDLVLGVFSMESVGVATWIASVIFVSSICFGNLGRRLVPQRP